MSSSGMMVIGAFGIAFIPLFIAIAVRNAWAELWGESAVHVMDPLITLMSILLVASVSAILIISAAFVLKVIYNRLIRLVFYNPGF
jgi:hypothetical protein